jgi:DNA-damage-inducible protein D
MLKIYDYLDEVLTTQRIQQVKHHQRLLYYASEIMERMGETSATDFDETLFRTMKVCTSLEISIADNFKKIYRYDGEKMVKDWRLSPLASYLLLLNGNPMNPSVAKAQMYAVFYGKNEKGKY